jgi:hypothetical protein
MDFTRKQRVQVFDLLMQRTTERCERHFIRKESVIISRGCETLIGGVRIGRMVGVEGIEPPTSTL